MAQENLQMASRKKLRSARLLPGSKHLSAHGRIAARRRLRSARMQSCPPKFPCPLCARHSRFRPEKSPAAVVFHRNRRKVKMLWVAPASRGCDGNVSSEDELT